MVPSFLVIFELTWFLAVDTLLVILAGSLFYWLKRRHSKLKKAGEPTFTVWLGSIANGFFLWGVNYFPLVRLTKPLPEHVSWWLLAISLFLCVVGSGTVQWLLTREKPSHAKIAVGGCLLAVALMSAYTLQWQSLHMRLLLPHETNQSLFLCFSAVVATLSFSLAGWLAMYAKSASLQLQKWQHGLSPITLGLAMVAQVWMSMLFAALMPLMPLIPVTRWSVWPGSTKEAVRSVLYPALGSTVISNLFFAEISLCGLIIVLLSLYVLRERQEGESLTRSVKASNAVGMILCDYEGNFLIVNDAFLEMSGYTRSEWEEAGVMNWSRLTPPEFERQDLQAFSELNNQHLAADYEKQLIRQDGQRVDILIAGLSQVNDYENRAIGCVLDITEKKKTLNGLQDSEARFRQLAESNLIGVAFWNIYGSIYDANDVFLCMLGYTRQDLRNNRLNWRMLVPPQDEVKQAAMVRKAITGDQVEPYETTFMHQNGDSVHVQVGFAMLYGAKEQGFSFVQDISERKRTEAALLENYQRMKETQERLKESESRFRLMAEQSPIMIWVSDHLGMLTYVNRQMLEFHGGFGKGDLPPTWWENIHAQDEALVNEIWAAALQKQEMLEVTFREQRHDGEERWLIATANPIHSVEGEFWGFVGTLADITDQKRVQEHLESEVISRTVALQENMTLLHSIIENVPAIIFLKEAKALRFKMFNKVGRELFGFVDHEYLDKNDYDYFPKEQADFFTLKDKETLAGYDLVDIPEEPIQDRNGEMRILHTKKVPILDETGKPAYLLGVSEDITEFKKTQDQILNLNVQLQDQLQAISAANKALESFSYSVSHDLRAPLRTIDGYSQIVLESYSEQLDDTGKRYLTQVREGSQQMAKLIDDMLNLSRLSRSELRKETVNLSELVRAITQSLEECSPDREVEFIIEDELYAEADRRLIQSVLQNLLDNAWKFTSHHAHAVIEFGKLHEVGGKAVYFVRDDGAGFDMNYVDKLFGAFQRLHTASEFTGNGIGLTSVQRIINRHGGEVWAQGEIEKGAVFYFTL
jgi:PAS domain S-box-containing protein